MTLPGISGAPLLIKDEKPLRVQDVFNTSLWSGTAVARTITTGIDSSSGSLVWIKSRSNTLTHNLFDTYRGNGVFIATNTTNANATVSQSLTAFSSSGYSIGTSGQTNSNGATFVGWQFRPASKFFDIIQYTGNGTAGRAINHSLGQAPGMIVVKRIDSTSDWNVWHTGIDTGQIAKMNTNAASVNSSIFGGVGSPPTDTQFTVSADASVNASGGEYIAYVFGSNPTSTGMIACGSYIGNGLSAGPSVITNWPVQYLMIKRTNNTGDWLVYDTSRDTSVSESLAANSSAVASTNSAQWWQSTSAGFSIDTNIATLNQNGGTYIYMAVRAP